MDRYINANELENKLIEHKKDEYSNLNKHGYDTWRNAFKIALRELHNTPTADVRPVVRGEWMFAGDGIVECSECKETYESNVIPRNFCPNCGANLRGAIK